MTAASPVMPDEPPRALTRREVFDALSPLVGRVASALIKRHPHLARHRDDLIQEGLLKVWTAAGRYDPSRSKPRTFVARHIRGAMVEWLRRRSDQSGVSSQTRSLRLLAGEFVPSCQSYTGAERAAADVPALACTDPELTDGPAAELAAAIRKSGAALSDRERDTLVAYFANGQTLREIGAAHGVSEARVSFVMSRALQLIRESMTAGNRSLLN